MISSLRLINFKPFENQFLLLRPLTLLSGLNSTGKSSVLQSLLLLRQSYQQSLLLEMGLGLNGDLVRIGTAQDALFEGAGKEDPIGFDLVWEKIKKRIRTGVSDGVELWNRREELFPNLEFCDAVSKQLQNIRTRQLELQPVVKTLFELQNCCKNWNTGFFSVEGYLLEESGESEATVNKYSKERTFRCPDGQERVFERHVKLRLCNWRIHFFAEKPGKVIIGYVGRHLPTVKYRT